MTDTDLKILFYYTNKIHNNPEFFEAEKKRVATYQVERYKFWMWRTVCPMDASSTLSNPSIKLYSPNFDDFNRACVLLIQQEMIHVDPPAQAKTEVPALREVFPL